MADTVTGTEGEKDASTTPFSAFERMVAWRYLRPRKKEAAVSIVTIISLVGVTLGVAALIIVMAVMNGLRGGLLDSILGLNGHIIVQPSQMSLTDYEAVTDRINGVEGVQFALPTVQGETLASGNVGAGTGTLVRGVRPEDLGKLSLIADNIKEGSLEEFTEGEGVAVGIGMANSLGLIIGERLTLISPEGDVTPFGTTPRRKSYPVTAIFESGRRDYDSQVVFLPLEEAQLYFNQEGVVQIIEVFVDDPDAVDDLKPLIEEAGQRPMFLNDWRQINRTLYAALHLERNAMFMVLSIVVLIASLNIISSLIMLAKEKGRGIAILRTMGATQSAILRIFIMAGIGVGAVGAFAGFLLGVLVSVNVGGIQRFINWINGSNVIDISAYNVAQLTARIDPWETLAALALALALAFLAAILPAMRAARLDPVEALRYE